VSKHAPGPWTIERYGGDSLVVHSDAETRVCFMATPGVLGSLSNIKANARLIAAAPEMLEALTLLHNNLAEYQRINHLGGYDNHDMRLARAAIAKATGGAP
jgi:hypothetical protein